MFVYNENSVEMIAHNLIAALELSFGRCLCRRSLMQVNMRLNALLTCSALIRSLLQPRPQRKTPAYAAVTLSGANMMAIIVKVAAGKRPCLEPISDDWPGECQQMVDLMKRCWDQDPKQRPSFTGVVAKQGTG